MFQIPINLAIIIYNDSKTGIKREGVLNEKKYTDWNI